MGLHSAMVNAIRFNFLYADEYLFKQGWVYPESYVPYCMLRFMLKGSAVFVIDGKAHTVRRGQAAYIPEGCTLACFGLEEETAFISIRFAVTAQPEGSDFLREFFHLQVVMDARDPAILSSFQAVVESAKSQRLSRWFDIRGHLELILARLVDQQEAAEPLAEEASALTQDGMEAFSKEWVIRREQKSMSIRRDARIQAVVEYLSAHPEISPSSEELCGIAQMSPSSFRRHFKEHTGKSPGEFIKELRMMTAARQLLVTDKRISDIAYELGFEGQNYFSRMFKEVFGVSPSLYRKTSRA